jgi:hypothetical protein
MFVVLSIVSIGMMLVRFYPWTVLHWIDGLDALLEERYQRQVDHYLRQLHERISALKVQIAERDLDPLTRIRLQQICDEYERDIRAEVLNSTDEERVG